MVLLSRCPYLAQLVQTVSGSFLRSKLYIRYVLLHVCREKYILVLIVFASSEGSDKPVQMRSLVRAFAACTHK